MQAKHACTYNKLIITGRKILNIWSELKFLKSLNTVCYQIKKQMLHVLFIKWHLANWETRTRHNEVKAELVFSSCQPSLILHTPHYLSPFHITQNFCHSKNNTQRDAVADNIPSESKLRSREPRWPKNILVGQAWRFTYAIPILEQLGQKCHEFKSNLRFTVRL